MTRFFIFGSILAGASALAAGLAINDYIPHAIGVALLGLAWIAAYARGVSWVSNLAFALFVFISIVGIWAKISPWLAFICIASSLTAWDLIAFIQRLALTADKADSQKMERAHFARLGLVIGLGALGYVAVNQMRVNLTFGGAAILALLVIWGVSALIYSLRSRE